MQDIHCAPKPHFKLISDIPLILILARANDAITGTVDNDIDAAPVVERFPNDSVDSGADADVTESGEEAVWGLIRDIGLNFGDGFLVSSTNGGDGVVVRDGGEGDGAANVACCAEDLRRVNWGRNWLGRETYHPHALLRRVVRTRWVAACGQLKSTISGPHGGRLRGYRGGLKWDVGGRSHACVTHDIGGVQLARKVGVLQAMEEGWVQVIIKLWFKRVGRLKLVVEACRVLAICP